MAKDFEIRAQTHDVSGEVVVVLLVIPKGESKKVVKFVLRYGILDQVEAVVRDEERMEAAVERIVRALGPPRKWCNKSSWGASCLFGREVRVVGEASWRAAGAVLDYDYADS